MTLSSIAALQLAVSCGPETVAGNAGSSGAGGALAGGAAGTQNGTAAGGAAGGVSNGGASGSTATAGTSNGGVAGSNGAAGGQSNGGAAGSPGGEGGGGGQLVDAGDASAGDSGATSAADGEPCPNGDECAEGLICVGYGNPLPNGESTACRRSCTQGAPPPDCTCVGGGFCEESAGSGGTGGTGSSGDADGGPACGQIIVNAGCADADDGTTDFQSGEFQGCLHWRDLGDGLGWIHYETFGGFHYDLQTALGWVTRTNSGTMTLAEVEAFCLSFSIAGLSDWRVPTIDEARSLAGGCAETAPGGSCPLSAASCLSASCGISEDCTSCTGNAGPYQPGNYYCRTDVELCSGFHTTSLCPDCLTPGDWRCGTINGNFISGSVDDAQFPTCVMENIPNAVPCRN